MRSLRCSGNLPWTGAEAGQGEGLGEAERLLRGQDWAPLSVCLPLAGARGPHEMVQLGEWAHPLQTSSFLSRPPSLALGKLSTLPSCGVFQPRAGACEGPHSLGWRMGYLAKAGLFPFPALNLLLASRGAERNSVGSLVSNEGGARQAPCQAHGQSWSLWRRVPAALGEGE